MKPNYIFIIFLLWIGNKKIIGNMVPRKPTIYSSKHYAIMWIYWIDFSNVLQIIVFFQNLRKQELLLITYTYNTPKRYATKCISLNTIFAWYSSKVCVPDKWVYWNAVSFGQKYLAYVMLVLEMFTKALKTMSRILEDDSGLRSLLFGVDSFDSACIGLFAQPSFNLL